MSAAIMLLMVAAIALGVWLIVTGGPFWPIVFGLLLGLADDRTVELRADEAAARAAGTEDVIRMLDVAAMLPSLITYVQHVWLPPNEDRGGPSGWKMATG